MAAVERALVIGGGIGGLGAATALAQRGIDVEIVELKPDAEVYGVAGVFEAAIGEVSPSELDALARRLAMIDPTWSSNGDCAGGSNFLSPRPSLIYTKTSASSPPPPTT